MNKIAFVLACSLSIFCSSTMLEAQQQKQSQQPNLCEKKKVDATIPRKVRVALKSALEKDDVDAIRQVVRRSHASLVLKSSGWDERFQLMTYLIVNKDGCRVAGPDS